MAKQTPLYEPEDLDWVKETHGAPSWAKFVVLHGNEDCPSTLECWRCSRPRHDAAPDRTIIKYVSDFGA